jgi:hypothetical protein
MVCLIGPVLAGLFAIAVYAFYGNVNWGSPASTDHAWIEPVFWALMASGVVALALRDVCTGVGGFCRTMRRPHHTRR